MTTNKLPSKFSELIRLGLKDLGCALNKPEKYKIDMGIWHELLRYDNSKVCTICLSGAVMVCSLGVPWEQNATPAGLEGMGKITRHDQNMLLALNELRRGRVGEAAYLLDDFGAMEQASNFLNRRITPYRDDPDAFKRDMASLANDLEAVGL